MTSGKVGYCVFYVAFIAALLFFSADMGQDIIAVSGSTAQLSPPQVPDTGSTLLDALTFLFNLAVFAVTTFGALIIISTEFTLLFVFIVLPLTFGFAWAVFELARGN